MIKRADATLAAPLQRLVGQKSAAGYGAAAASAHAVNEARRAAERLLTAARIV